MSVTITFGHPVEPFLWRYGPIYEPPEEYAKKMHLAIGVKIGCQKVLVSAAYKSTPGSWKFIDIDYKEYLIAAVHPIVKTPIDIDHAWSAAQNATPHKGELTDYEWFCFFKEWWEKAEWEKEG